ncbi:hypothetical protein D3C83_06640 [compost metagenome]
MTALEALLGDLEKVLPGPFLPQFVAAGDAGGRIHLGDVEAGVLFQQVDAAARRQRAAAVRGRHADPMAVDLAEILAARCDGAVLRGQVFHHVVERHQLVGVRRGVPNLEVHDVVADASLRLGGDRQRELVAVRRDQVEAELDLFLVGPFLRDLLDGLAGSRDPVVPNANAQLAGRVGAAHERRGQRPSGKDGRGEGGGLQYGAPRQTRPRHA